MKKRTIVIVSGEGENGHAEYFRGKDTDRAIKMRLTKERCHGDRWARAVILIGFNEHGAIGQDFETGLSRTFPMVG